MRSASGATFWKALDLLRFGEDGEDAGSGFLFADSGSNGLFRPFVEGSGEAGSCVLLGRGDVIGEGSGFFEARPGLRLVAGGWKKLATLVFWVGGGGGLVGSMMWASQPESMCSLMWRSDTGLEQMGQSTMMRGAAKGCVVTGGEIRGDATGR